MAARADYDLIVVGGGHAGVEAALVGSRLGCRTLVLTSRPSKVGVMPCNPSIGGPAKSHLVREIDALGGEMARAIDDTFIHIRRLNTGKGQAVQALRAQADRPLYNERLYRALLEAPGLEVRAETVVALLWEGKRIVGVRTHSGLELRGGAVVLCTGTFLAGVLHLGPLTLPGGRAGEGPAFGLSDSLRALGLELGRLKTGTCPRLHRETVDFKGLDVLPSSSEPLKFSDLTSEDRVRHRPGVSCYITRTNEATRRAVMENLDRSPLYDGSGSITGTGPRYCPSLEDKFVRFPERQVHLVFLEPEGMEAKEIYLQGVSTSMPLDVQYAMVRSLPGLERAEIIRPGYAVEYDYVLPTQLDFSLGVRHWEGLYLAGQINGTSGYEEAAAQGLIAGLNATRWLDGKEPFVLGREQGYTGVLIDDLVCKGTSEPYRMHTSRAEYRLLLREDNADDRLTPLAREMGLISEERWAIYEGLREESQREIKRLTSCHLTGELAQKLSEAIEERVAPGPSLAELLHRPQISLALLRRCEGLEPLPCRVVEKVEATIRYGGYIERQEREVKRAAKLENVRLPQDLEYREVVGLAGEAVEKLSRLRPHNVGQASRIPGLSPADINALLIHLRKRSLQF